MVIIPVRSGVFVNERGTSSTFLSLLTKQDVLDALQQQPYSNFEIRSMVGGGFLDGLKSASVLLSGHLDSWPPDSWDDHYCAGKSKLGQIRTN